MGSYFSQPSRPPPEDTDCFSQVQSHTCGHMSAPVLTCPGPAGGCNAGCQEGPPLCLPLCGPESGGHGIEPSLYLLQKTVLRCSSQSSSEALGCPGHQQPQQRPLEDTFLHLHSLFLCLVSPCATRPPEKQTPPTQASVPSSAVWNNPEGTALFSLYLSTGTNISFSVQSQNRCNPDRKSLSQNI